MKKKKIKVNLPATLLAKPLLDASNNDLRWLGMHATDFVPWIVSLGVTQICLAPFNLAPRWLSTHCTTATSDFLWRGGLGSITRFGRSHGTRRGILKVNFAPKFQTIEWVRGGVWWGRRGWASWWVSQRARTHFHSMYSLASTTLKLIHFLPFW